MSKKGLGRGLSSLLPDNDVIEEKEDIKDVSEMKLTLIEPNKNQPRKSFDKEKLEELSESIKNNGLIQPIIIKPKNNGRYLIVAGERRFRAAKKAGLSTVPVIIRDYTDEQVAQIALIENLQREDLNPIEEAMGYKKLMDEFLLTQEMISEKIGKSRSAIANTLRLLSLDDDIKKLVEAGKLSSGHARAVLSVEDKELRLLLANKIIEENLNVRQAEALAKTIAKEKPQKKAKKKNAYDIEIEGIMNRMTSMLGTKVNIHHTKKKGKIEIEYYGNADLERILSLLNLEL